MTVETLDLELKAEAVEDSGRFAGYASVFGGVDAYKDTVAAGAFAKSLKSFTDNGRLPPLLWSHSSDLPIGRWLAMQEDDRGLKVSGKLNLKTQKGAEAHALLQEGDLSGLSIGFRTKRAATDRNTGVRELQEIDLIEVSLDALPADDSARITDVRSFESWTARDFEKFLRDAGLPKVFATAVVNNGFNQASAYLRDAGSDEAEELVQMIAESTERLRQLVGGHSADDGNSRGEGAAR